MSVGLQHRWMDSRSIDQCDRVVCMNVKNGHWSREWLDSVIVFFLQNDWLVSTPKDSERLRNFISV